MPSTASVVYPTRSSATSSPASPSRTPRALPRSPTAGAGSGPPSRSSSSTTTSSPAPRSRDTTRATSPPPCPASSRRTRAPSAASTSRRATWRSSRARSCAGCSFSPSRASNNSSSPTARGHSTSNSPPPSSASPHSPASTSPSGSFPTRTASFPNLHELGLCSVVLENGHLDFILSRSPVLEILCLQNNMLMDRLTLTSRTLRCVHVIADCHLEIAVEDAPLLARLIIWIVPTCKGSRKILILNLGHAPGLSCLGYLEPEFHTLQLAGTAIKAGTNETMMPTVKVLALKVRFGVRNEAKILPCLLRCFPNVERLHIVSKKTAESNSKLSLQFWEQSGVVESIRSNVKVVIYHNFRGAQCELCFLEFLLKNAGVLSKLVIAYDKDTFTSLTEVESVVEPVFDVIWATSCCSLVLVESVFTEGEGLKMLNIRGGSSFSITDPFAFTG